MNNLTAKEQRIFNNLSRVHDRNIKLGDKVQEVIEGLTGPFEVIEEGTPVNAVSATKTLTLAGVVVHGETVTIGDDVYEFVADALQTVTREEFIPVDIEANTTKAAGTLTMDMQPIAGDKVTIGVKEFTFVPVGTDTADGEVSVGVDLAGAQAALVAAINGTDGINDPHSLVSAGDFSADACVITALIGGTAGNNIDTTSNFTAGTNAFAAAKLATGADCTAANAITALVAAIDASDTQGVGAVDGEGNTVVLTADVPGIIGNDINIATDMANGSFAGGATELSGGVDGTISDGVTLLFDNTYIYICLAANTITGKNWRRVTLNAM